MDERHESDTQTESCRQCGDTGWMIEADRGTPRAQRCECWAVRQAAAMLARLPQLGVENSQEARFYWVVPPKVGTTRRCAEGVVGRGVRW